MDKLDSNALLPIRMYMSLIEFKNKLELRVKYDAITLGENIFSDFKIKWDNHEKFVRALTPKCANVGTAKRICISTVQGSTFCWEAF